MGDAQSKPPGPAPGPPAFRGQPSRNTGARNKFSFIPDNYHSLDQVQTALRQAGLESSNLIVGIDFTKSNEWTGKQTFGGRSLHAIGDRPNPYEQAVSIIGRTLAVFDDDNLIPCFGFGDATTHDQYVFSFYPDQRPCNGFDEALVRYRQIAPNLKLSGPTSFAPIIEAGIRTVEQSGGQYHVLVIVADGQVTQSVDTRSGSLSAQEKATMDALVRASNHPLSIILVGVGDGPWDEMRAFDDRLPYRAFDNFQFVNFSELMAKNMDAHRKEAAFALAALMEIPIQYKATIELKLLGNPTGHLPSKVPLPPPQAVLQADRVYGSSFANNQAPRPQQYPPGGQQYPPGGNSAQGSSVPYGSGASQASRPQQYPPAGNSAQGSSVPYGSGASQPPRQQYPPVGVQGSSDAYGSGAQQYNPSNIPTAYPPAGYPPSAPPHGHHHGQRPK